MVSHAMLPLRTKTDLQRLIDDEIAESLTLDYKRAQALAKDSPSRDELCKDVSAFANSAGGQIVYGIPEKDHKPQPLDTGVPNDTIDREWIERVIDSRVHPRIEGLVITPIPYDANHTGYVISIPQALARAPHQAPDKKYYKRQNFQSVPMEDYEIRDALRRASTPDLVVKLAFAAGRSQQLVDFEPGNDISKPIGLRIFVENRSTQPAHHVIVKVGIDTKLLHTPGHFLKDTRIADSDRTQYWLSHRISSPPDLPLFKEADPWSGAFTISVRGADTSSFGVTSFRLTTIVLTPGFEDSQHWFIWSRAGTLRLYTEHELP
jgi:hypothetical protein